MIKCVEKDPPKYFSTSREMCVFNKRQTNIHTACNDRKRKKEKK